MSWSGEPESVAAPVEYATWGTRVIAIILDILILIIPVAILNQLITQGAGTLLQIAYFVYFTGSTGQTLGKKAMKIKVVKADGGPMEYGTAALREIVGKFISAFILFIGFLWPLWDPRKQALHDKVASTLVVKVPD